MLTFSTNNKEISERLRKALGPVADKAIATGLTRGAFDVRDDEINHMSQVFDRPKPFTLRGVAVKKAVPSRRVSYVYIRRIQAAYIERQISGGSTMKRKVVPGPNKNLDAFGNLPRRATKGANVYIGKYKGKRAYFKLAGPRGDKRLDLIGFIPWVRSYRRRFRFYQVGKRSAQQNVSSKIMRELQRAGVV